MTDGNVALVKSLYEAFQRSEIGTIIAALTADVDWQVHGRSEDYPTIGSWKTPGGV